MTTDPAATEQALEEMLGPQGELEVDKIFRACVKLDGSDLHLKVGRPPVVRVKGQLRPLKSEPLKDEDMIHMLSPLLTAPRRAEFEEFGGSDFAHTIDVDGESWRFRVNMLRQMGHIGLVARKVNNWIPDFAGLHLPPVVEQLCRHDQGMVLLAGPTGSGKSTSIASMLNWINHNYRKHILTLEDPVEFLFQEEKCLITQREVGIDVKDFSHGMRQAVREDPDVMLLGEMRDHETFLTAMQAAETGHLVFGTIHASSAATTIGRILDLFPEDMHDSLRGAIAFNMKGIVVQKLLPCLDEKIGRVPAVEVLTFTSRVRKAILEHEEDKISDLIRMGANEGMQDFTKSLQELIEKDLVDRPTAFEAAPNVDALKMALKGIDVSQPGIL